MIFILYRNRSNNNHDKQDVLDPDPFPVVDRSTTSCPGCSAPGDDPAELLGKIQIANRSPPTKKLPRLDAGAEWCLDSRTKKPEFPRGAEPQKWQKVDNRDVIVFSAFVDYRAAVGGPWIRIVGCGLQEQFNKIGHLFCTLWYEENDVPVTVGPAIYDRIYPSLMHAEMWVAHFILCPLPVIKGSKLKNPVPMIPYAVSVAPKACGGGGGNNSRAANVLMILNRFPEIPAEDSFAVCFPAIYAYRNFKNWELFIEWIEINKILGMDSAYFYNFSMSANTTKVFRSYATDAADSIHVVDWKFPGSLQTSYFSQRSAINDCLYRAGHKHRYVAVLDIDELMVPRKHDNWIEMMKDLSVKPNVGVYLFQHAYFRRNNNNTGEEPYLITQQSLWRTDVVTPPGKIRCKAMYVAAKTIKADIHFPYQLVNKETEMIVEPEVAMLHHYRIEPMESFRKNPEQFHFIEDERMLTFGNRLKRSVLDRIATLRFY